MGEGVFKLWLFLLKTLKGIGWVTNLLTKEKTFYNLLLAKKVYNLNYLKSHTQLNKDPFSLSFNWP